MDQTQDSFDAQKVLAEPEGHDMATLEKALSAPKNASNDTQQTKEPEASTSQDGTGQAVDPMKEIERLREEIKRQQTAFAKELGQYRKLQSEYAKLPKTIEQVLEAKLKNASLTPEQAELERQVQQQWQALNEHIQQQIQQAIEQRMLEMEQERVQLNTYVRTLQELAGDKFAEYEPHLTKIALQLAADLRSDDEDKVKAALAKLDKYMLSPEAAIFEAMRAAANGQQQQKQTTQQQQPSQPKGANVAPRVGSSAPAPTNAPKKLSDMTPEDFANANYGLAELEKLLKI
jgi:DNA repair exonuclease SbcCD ATPase subunit